MTVLKIQTPLDETDISILKSIEAEPEKVSTRELSRKLDIPDRTVRYRLAKLKEKKLICPQKIQTYERKIGLGERLLFLQSNTEKEEDLIKVLEETDLFYYFSPTYGRYDGFVVYCMYPLVAPRMILQLAEELKEHDLVRDFYIFDLVDYTTKGAEVSPFLPGSTWEWEDWSKEIEKIMKKGCKLDLELEEFPQAVRFDLLDIKIMKHIVENPESILKDTAEALGLKSVTQVHKRVKRLEEAGVIRGIKPCFTPFQESINIMCIFKSRNHAQEILCGFNKLPFGVQYAMESAMHYQVMVALPPNETNQFLQRISMFRRYCEEFIVQVLLKGTSKGFSHLLAAYNQETKSWEIPLTDILQRIRNMSQTQRSVTGEVKVS